MSLLLEVIVLSRLELAVIVQGAALNQVDQSKEGQRDKSRCEWVTQPIFYYYYSQQMLLLPVISRYRLKCFV